MVRQRMTPGAIVKIRIDDEYHTYGRIFPWEATNIAVYDWRTKEDIRNMTEIISRPILFFASVSDWAVTEGRWLKVGKIPLTQEEIASMPDRFMQDTTNIHNCQIVAPRWKVRDATIEECEGLERVISSQPWHVEERLRDHYAGRKNSSVEHFKLRRPGNDSWWPESLTGGNPLEGEILKIKFDNDYHTYGRIIRTADVAVYDCKTKEDITGLNEIISKPVMFVVLVFYDAIASGRWTNMGKIPVRTGEISIPDRFRQDYFNPRFCSIMSSYGPKAVESVDECKGLEPLEFWEAQEVEERIRDHYAGRKNRMLEFWKLRWPSEEDILAAEEGKKKIVDFKVSSRLKKETAKPLKDYSYEELKAFFNSMWEMMSGGLPIPLSEEEQPPAVLDLAEEEGQPTARKSVTQGIQDLIVSALYMDRETRKEYDKFLKSKGAPTLSEMRKTFFNEIGRILEHSIENEEEYYLIKEITADEDFPGLNNRERERADDLLAEFEEKISKGFLREGG